jgi:hypothetical protein
MSQKKKESKSSKGERKSINPSTVTAVKKQRLPIDVALNKLDAWKRGKNPWIVSQTRTGELTVRANQVWGDPRGYYDTSRRKVESDG